MSSLLSRICRLSKQTFSLIRPRRSLLTFMVFLVLSGIFWLSTALNEYYDYEIKIPVFIEHIPKNVVVTTELEDTLKVMVHDKGFAMLQYIYGDKIHKIAINLSSVTKQSDKYVVSNSELQRLVSKQFYSSTTVNSIKPEHIEICYCRGLRKDVSVRLTGDVFPASDYYLAHVQIIPERVTVYSSKQLLDSIRYIETEKLNIQNFSDTVITTVTLKSINGARFSQKTIRVELYPDILTEELVDVPITVVNLPKGINVRTFPSHVHVKFNVGVSQYRTINKRQFEVVVDYNQINLASDKCPLQISKMPNGITKASLEFKEVDYLIEN